MVGQHAAVLRQPVGILLLDRVADPRVLDAPLGLGLGVVRHFMGQRVLERVDHFRPDARVVNQLGRAQRRAGDSSSAAASGTTRSSTRRGNSRPITAATRSTSRDGAIEPLEASEQHVLHLVRNLDLRNRPHEPDFVPAPLEQSAFLERSQDLFDEERVAVRRVVNQLLQLRRESWRPRSEQPIRPLSERETLASVSCVPNAPCAERQRVSGPVCRAQQNASGRQALGHHRQKFARRLIHPVQVFEHDDDRPRLGGGVQEPADGLEDARAQQLRVERRERAVARIDRQQRSKERTDGRKASPNAAVARSIRSPITSSESPG